MTPERIPVESWRGFPGATGFLAGLSRITEVRPDPKEMAAKYWTDVEGWAKEFVDWQGETPNFGPYQVESWKALLQPQPPFGNRVCVRGPRGCGKSFSQAMQLLHFACTRHGAGIEWKVITTAGSLGQLRRYLWPEVHKWASRLRWDRLGFEWRLGRELNRMSIHGFGGSLAESAAPTNHQLLEGAHAKELLFLCDEAKAIPVPAWDAIQGAFFAGLRRGHRGYWRADSTPGPSSGRFYDIHRRRRGLETWWTRHVKPQEAIDAGMLEPAQVAEAEELWGPESRMYRNHVLAEFSETSGGQIVFPLDWVEQAIERGYEWLEEHVPQDTLPENLTRSERIAHWWDRAAPFLPPLSHLGLDIGGGGPGRDPAALAPRHGHIIAPIQIVEGPEDYLIGRVQELYRKGCIVVPDVVNAAKVARRLERTMKVVDCNASLPSQKKDRSQKLQLLNVRTELWWGGRERLDPSYDPTEILPDDQTLMGELCEPEWMETSDGKIKVEDKRQVAKRVRKLMGREDQGGSTNRADACLQAFWAGAKASSGAVMGIESSAREVRSTF